MVHTPIASPLVFLVSFSKISVPGTSLLNFLPTFEFQIIITEFFLSSGKLCIQCVIRNSILLDVFMNSRGSPFHIFLIPQSSSK